MSVPTSASSAPIDHALLADLVSQLGNDLSLRDDLLDSYVVEAAEEVARLVSALRAGDVGTVASVAHSLRSTSALLGAVGFAQLLLEVEQVAGTSPADVALLGPPLEAEYLRVAEALTRVTAAS